MPLRSDEPTNGLKTTLKGEYLEFESTFFCPGVA